MSKKRVKIILISLFSIFILYFIFSENKAIKTVFEFEDIELLSLSKKADDSSFDQEKSSKEFLDNYFKVWNQNKLSISKEDAMWGFSVKDVTRYLENLNSFTPDWIEYMYFYSDFESFNTVNKKAITIKNANLRVFPTISPLFKNPEIPGEGFPFDYNQNSLLKINTPIFISHYSKDKAWAYIESSYVYGWIQVDYIAFVDDEFIKDFRNNNYYIAIKEKFAIYNPFFVEHIKSSTIFPKKDDKFIIARKDKNQNAKIDFVNIEKENITNFPLKNNLENRAKILKEFLNEPYGWGGAFFHRDCSSFTQDYFSIFAKSLPRNSKAQTSIGTYHDISDKSLEDKKKYIKKYAKPFSSLIYLPGHIVLYLGQYEGEPIIAHNLWSIKLKDKNNNEKRKIVGKTIISTLDIGKELEEYDEENSILNKVSGISIF
ncbi:C40 family peptidase [Aliarcobacter thereius]|uniref:SH3 domain of the SH3b1 type n=2 Tax=Aliarcobacter thereius TaxID=544718 RepID=A0A1C0B5G2_9BACT|nr:SH3 domain-containing C40 family peptidase [Aliarcobacter thereius]OCL91294.1 SH3 domain of the SH3b1 type [Aliarcobacter thereius]OCL95870.1 SH3 domain of the SH3b1 type [Aliarcobacter thereius LMG 24486]OCL98161.1 SH3 domain of the SH3b1 type [Aliarcobacter thereius]QBF16157.1 NlpC/P60 family lipoprotein (SH3b1 type SH3 domain) [Aliarcobacter thereius LMG 24486]TLS94506.1 hypothetical protein FE244_00035 [Aliarcobacter thereius]